MFKKSHLYLDTDQNWKAAGVSRKNPIFIDHLLKTMNSFQPIFETAKIKSEFEFIMVLLRIVGIQDVGWDAWENTIDVVKTISKLHQAAKFNASIHLQLWLYGHIIEASEPYNVIANMLNVASGGRYQIDNFPDKVRGRHQIPQSPSEKVDALKEKSTSLGMAQATVPFEELVDRDLRNAIFHSDYSLYENEIRIRKGPKLVYASSELNEKINHALGYIEGMDSLIKSHARSYKLPKIIDVHPEFSVDPDEKAVVIVRKGEGAIGLKDNWTSDQLRRGKIPFQMGRLLRYEVKKLDQDHSLQLLPMNRINMINKVLVFLPRFVRRQIIRILKQKKWY